MKHVEKHGHGTEQHYTLHGRRLENGDRLMVRLHGNAGWLGVEVTGLPERLAVAFTSDDGRRLVTTLSDHTEVRWPDEEEMEREPRRQPAVD